CLASLDKAERRPNAHGARPLRRAARLQCALELDFLRLEKRRLGVRRSVRSLAARRLDGGRILAGAEMGGRSLDSLLGLGHVRVVPDVCHLAAQSAGLVTVTRRMSASAHRVAARVESGRAVALWHRSLARAALLRASRAVPRRDP